MAKVNTDELLTIHAASPYVGVTVATLRRYRERDIGPESFILNGKVVYERAKLDRWLEDQRAATRRGGRFAHA